MINFKDYLSKPHDILTHRQRFLQEHALTSIHYTYEQSIMQQFYSQNVVGDGGLEPPTSSLSVARSNQLS